MPKRDADAAVQLHFRVREDLRARLETEAKRKGVTLSAEIARRLEESFQLDAKLRELEITGQNAIRAVQAAEARAMEDRRRANALTDYILERQAPGIRMPRPEESK